MPVELMGSRVARDIVQYQDNFKGSASLARYFLTSGTKLRWNPSRNGLSLPTPACGTTRARQLVYLSFEAQD